MTYLTVLGHSNIDVQIRVSALPGPGESRPVSDRRTVYGGTANNIARHAASLGVPTRLWSRVGDDFPVDWRKALEADGLDLSWFESSGARTPTCFVFTDDAGEQAYCMDQGAMAAPYEVPVQVVEGATWLHVSTGDPHSYLPLVEAAREAGVRIGFDPGQEIHFAYDTASFEALLDRADVFFCNDVELRKALGFLRYGSAEQLLDHVDAVVVTHGAEGATLHRAKHKPVTVPAVEADVVDPTGAGDALRAGFYAGLHAGLDMEAALRCGVEAAAVAVRAEGPQSRLASPSDVPTLRTS